MDSAPTTSAVQFARRGRSDVAQGISNRESPDEEAQDRKEHPPLGTDGASVDVTEQSGEEAIGGDRQTSQKAGSRSSSQKEDFCVPAFV